MLSNSKFVALYISGYASRLPYFGRECVKTQMKRRPRLLFQGLDFKLHGVP